MRSWVMSFTLGVMAGCFIPELLPFGTLLCFCLPIFLTYHFPRFRLAAGFSLGIAWLIFNATMQKQEILPVAFEQQNLLVRGIIRGLPQNTEFATRILLVKAQICPGQDISDCAESPDAVEREFLLNDYTDTSYEPGQQWLLEVRLKRPHGMANPGGFDYEAWLFSQGIDATGYVKDSKYNRVINQDVPNGFFYRVDRVRQKFRQAVSELSLEEPAFLLALTIGDRSAFTEHARKLLSATGTNHLMVISGLHLSLVAWLIFRFNATIMRSFPSLCLTIPACRLATWIAFAGTGCFGLFAGFSLPVQRALVMVFCVFTGVLLDRQTQGYNHLSLALLLVLLIDPFALMNTGFWLSFGAVYLLLLSLNHSSSVPRNKVSGPLFKILRSQFFPFSGLAPLMLYLFSSLSLLTPVVNLLAIPFISMLVVPLCLLAVLVYLLAPSLLPLIITLPDFLLALYTDALEKVIELVPDSGFRIPQLPLWGVGIQFVLITVLLCYKNLLYRLAVLLLIFLPYMYSRDRPAQQAFNLQVLDTGQGLAAVLVTSNHLLIYDTGPAYSPRFNAGSGVVIPFIQAYNLGQADILMVSHGDSDHAGGARALLTEFPDSKFMVGEKIPGTDRRQVLCESGQYWVWDKVHFQVIGPGIRFDRSNNNSCVLRVSAGDYSVLLPGDIEKDAELALVANRQIRIAANILLAPHHGSRTSSTPPFIRDVAPEYTVVTAGYLNRFNHPHSDVVSRYKRFGSSLVHTSQGGMITFRISDKDGIQGPELYRQQIRRFWYP